MNYINRINQIYIRHIVPNDAKDLIYLYDSVWPETAGRYEGKTKWMLSSSPLYGVCACDNDKIIGARLSFVVNILFGDKKINSVQYGNSSVHKDYRRLGIFTKMNIEFLKLFFDENNNDLIYNVSVEASKLAYQKLGWEYINALSKQTYFANIWNVLLKTKFDLRKLSGNIHYDQQSIPPFDTFDDELLEIRESHFRISKNIHTYYSKSFFEWRLNSDTNIAFFNIEGLGTVIYKIGSRKSLRVITIGEIFLYEYNRANFHKILKLLVKEFTVDILEVLITDNHPCFIFYKRFGFVSNPFKKYLNLGVKVVSTEMKGICLNPKNWALSSLDIDTF